MSSCGNSSTEDTGETKLTAYYTGLKDLSADELMESSEKLKSSAAGYEELPYKYDLSAQYPTPGDQGQQGSCAAWAAAYALHSQQEMNDHGWTYDDESHLFSPSFVYNQANEGIDGGISIVSALKILKNVGSATLAEMPYNDADFLQTPSEQALSAGWSHRISDWYAVQGINPIKKAIMDFGGVIVGIPCYPEIFGLNSDDSVYDDTSGVNDGSHAICLLGWDDDLQAFKFINSWGTDWGAGGFGYVSYQIVNDSDRAYYMVDMIEYGRGINAEYIVEPDPDIDLDNDAKKIIIFPNYLVKNEGEVTWDVLPTIMKNKGESMYLPKFESIDFDWSDYYEIPDNDPPNGWMIFSLTGKADRLYSDGNGNYKFISLFATDTYSEMDGWRLVTVSDGGCIDFLDNVDASEFILWGHRSHDSLIDSEYSSDTYTVQFDANGGTGDMVDLNLSARIGKSLPNCSFTKSGYDFSGWHLYYTDGYGNKYYEYEDNNYHEDFYLVGEQPEDYELTIYRDGQTFSAVNGTWALEAIWTPKPIVTVYVAQYDGSKYVDKRTELQVGAKFTFGKEQNLYEGHTFIGWTLFDASTDAFQYRSADSDEIIWASEDAQPAGYEKVIYNIGEVFDGFTQEYAGHEMIFWPEYSADIDYSLVYYADIEESKVPNFANYGGGFHKYEEDIDANTGYFVYFYRSYDDDMWEALEAYTKDIERNGYQEKKLLSYEELLNVDENVLNSMSHAEHLVYYFQMLMYERSEDSRIRVFIYNDYMLMLTTSRNVFAVMISTNEDWR
jgi:hypothetical protein